MELVPTVDIECINNPIQVSLCDDSSVVDTEFGGESQSVAVDGKVNDDEATQQHHVCSSPVQGQLFERIRHSTDNSNGGDAEEVYWLQKNEEYEFDMLDGISDISVDSTDYPVPEPKITLQVIAQRWLDKMESDDKNREPDGNKITNGVEFHEPKMGDAINTDREDKSGAPAKSAEINENEKVVHSPSPDCSDNSIQPQPANSTFTIKVEGGCAELNVAAISQAVTPSSCIKDNSGNSSASVTASNVPAPQKSSIPQLQVPHTKNTINEQMVCGEVAVIRECCNTTSELEPSSIMPTQSVTHGGATEKGSKPPAHPSGAMKKGPVVPSSIKPMFPARKLPVKNNSTIIKTPTKTNHSLQSSNQPHLPNQEIKISKLLKQKEPLNIRKSLLSRPIVVSKTIAKTGTPVSTGPCKPARLKKPVNKVNTKSHPLRSSIVPDQSTPIKEQVVSRRRSVAVSPQRDSSEAHDDEKLIPTKQRRRSGIPHLGAMTRDVKVPMSPCNKGDEQKTALGMSPIAAGKKLFRPAKGKATRQIGIPKPKTQLNFNTSFDPLEGMDLDGPPPGGSKLVHSPAEKENDSNTVHSQWSPIRRNKGITADEECIRCTKHTAKYVSS